MNINVFAGNQNGMKIISGTAKHYYFSHKKVQKYEGEKKNVVLSLAINRRDIPKYTFRDILKTFQIG